MFSTFDESQLALLVSSMKSLEEVFQSEFGIPLYLTWGTLLGAIRQNDFIKFDNDVDLAYLSKRSLDYEILEEHEYIVAVLKEKGFAVTRNSKGQIHVRVVPESQSNGAAVFNLDIWTTWIDEGRFYHYPDLKGELFEKDIVPFTEQRLRNEVFRVPKGFEKVLTGFYGMQWQEPDENYAWYPKYDANDKFEFLRSSTVINPTELPKHPRKASGLVITEAEEHFFVNGGKLKEEQRLNGTGILILELCTGENTVTEIIEILQKEFDLATAPEVAVIEFLNNALSAGLLSNENNH